MFLNIRLTFGEDLLFLSVQKSPNLCVFQCLAPRSFGHGRRRLTNRQAFSLGVIDVYSVCVMKHFLERGVIAINILKEPLLGELLLGQGLCEGLDMSFLEVVVLGLIKCEEVGLVIRLHLLFGEVRSVTTALKVVEECRILKENEKKRKLDGMESSKSKRNAHCMHG